MTRSSGFIFLLTRLLRGATCKHSACLLDDPISTHTPLARRDPPECILPVHPGYFYSHASCEARQRIDCIGGENYLISTHTPHAGRDEYPTGAGVQCFRFLLTRPMRGATLTHAETGNNTGDFYSHAPCGARPGEGKIRKWLIHFYSHAPCGARLAGVRPRLLFV